LIFACSWHKNKKNASKLEALVGKNSKTIFHT